MLLQSELWRPCPSHQRWVIWCCCQQANGDQNGLACLGLVKNPCLESFQKENPEQGCSSPPKVKTYIDIQQKKETKLNRRKAVINAALNGLHLLKSNSGAKMIQTKSKAEGAHPPAGALRASPLSDQRHKQGWVHNGLQKLDSDEAKQVSIKTCGEGQRRELREHRMALEQDVKQLRQSLGREDNKHKVLERALQRPMGVLPYLPSYLPPQTRKLLAEVAVLEEEVAVFENYILSLQQQLQIESQYDAVSKERTHWSSCSPSRK
ncbi:hypothetical protein O6H91_02G143100 [Diphasiastrum complanatum]|uniref:Uncharacterized protein n=1 Tax=Diphasiastrum complanatum TaxID=34168 RepID=A0ACC2ELB0_DIPCM|nr:hypothetical protein O6H91_02G143100 [Diphasiastrum complanatum]